MVINIYRAPLFYVPDVFLKRVDVNQNGVSQWYSHRKQFMGSQTNDSLFIYCI